MLSLCFICSEYPPGPHGGIGTYTQIVGRALKERGHSVRILGVHRSGFPDAEHEENEGIYVWRLRGSSHRFSWVNERLRLYRKAAEWSRRKEIDLVEAPDWGGPTAYWPRLSVPVVSRLHGSGSYFAHEMKRKPPRSTLWLERASLHRADYFSSVTQYAGQVTREVFGLNGLAPTVIYNPVALPPKPAEYSARSRSRVVYTGTLTEKKGIVGLIDAWYLVVQSREDAELHIYGKDGVAPSGSSMQRFLVDRLPLSCRRTVIFHGHVSRRQITEALSQARVGVFPSFSESFGLAPVECMATGCPTIYTRLSCGPEIIRDGIDGLLVDPHAPQEIASAVLRVLLDDHLAERLSVAGHQTATRRFSIDAVLPRYEEFYQECVVKFHRRTGEKESTGG